MGACVRRGRDRRRDAVFYLLDPRRQFLDADPGWLHRHGWTFLPRGLVGRRVQPVFPVPARPYGQCRVYHHRVRRAVGRCLLPAPGARPRREPPDAIDDPVAVDCTGAAADLAGDQHGLNTLEYQPEKIAAMEGDWETRSGMPLVLFGWPDQVAETNRWAVEIPYAGSLILTHSLNGTIRGLKEWPKADRPPVAVVFWAFRAMVGIGFLMLAIVVAGNWLRWTGRLYD